MLLAKDRILGETMIRMVPTSKLPNSSDFDPHHSLALQAIDSIADSSVIDFDLGYLPAVSSDLDLDLIPSLASPESSLGDFHLAPNSPNSPDHNCLSPNLTTDLDFNSITMFSPDAKMVPQGPHGVQSPPSYVPSASPVSLPPSSPYSPASRLPGIRFSSTDSANTASSSSSSSLNLKENLDELADLQRRVQIPDTQVPNSVLKRALEKPFENRQVPPSMNTDSDSGFQSVPAMEETKLASVLSMVMDDLFEHVRKEIKTQCALLNINPDPTCWTREEVGRWLRHKMQEFKIPAASCQPVLQWAAEFEGPGFLQISEEEFKARLPQGEQIYSALDMWRNAAYNQEQQPASSQVQPAQELYHVDDVLAMIDNEQSYQVPHGPPPEYSQVAKTRPPPPSFEDHMASNSSLTARMPSIDELLQHQEPVPPPPYPGTPTPTLTTLQPPMSHGSSTQDMTEDEDENQDETDPMSPPVPGPPRSGAPGPIRGSSSNIHLWQFVKELLNQPQHSGCIHWVDREQGIFKIVDSVRVAELWGKRKNRPAMNFDKLSRSLRQYYKKGIMKKTSRPQRLVYQFCSPYHL